MSLRIPVLLGSARQGRKSEFVAKFVHAQALAFGFEAPFLDVRDYLTVARTEGMEADKASSWSELMKSSDGLIIVSPEYNHGYPGELKMMLDQLDPEYAGKPVGIIGASNGQWGGIRMGQQLRQVMIALHMHPVTNAAYFTNVDTLFDAGGNMRAADEENYAKRVRGVCEDVAWWAEATKMKRNA